MALCYARPYSAFERGTNENANGMIRRHFPQGTDFAAVSGTRVLSIQTWLTTYHPIKIHDGKSAASFYLLSCPGGLFCHANTLKTKKNAQKVTKLEKMSGENLPTDEGGR